MDDLSFKTYILRVLSALSAMTTPNIERLINLNRFQNGIPLVPLVFYIPFGIILTLVRCFIFAHAVLVFYILSKIPLVHSVVLRVMFAVCGLLVTTDGVLQSRDRHVVLVANHVSSLDAFALSLVMHFCLAVEPFFSCDFTHLCKQVLVPADMTKGDVVQFIKTTVDENKLPVLIFPEGCRGNGSNGLLSFRVLPFQLGTAVQPIGIIVRRWFFNINISTFNSPWWADLLFTFFVPFTIYKIKYLPVTEHRDHETDEQFCERVQSNLGRAVGLLATEVTHSDVKEFVKSSLRAKSMAPSSTLATTSASVAGGSPSSKGNNAEPQNGTTERKITSSDSTLNVLFEQVREVLPHANSRNVLEDLEKTHDVDTTITNILEGRVKLEEECASLPPKLSSSQTDLETFKASSFPKSASDRQMSLQERKQAMLEAARKRYKEKHP